MLFSNPLPFIEDYTKELNRLLSISCADYQLSNIQRQWLATCIMGIISTNTICWSRFERASLGQHQVGALSWMFCNSKLPWAQLLEHSTRALMQAYDLREGVLAVDDSDRQRAKVTKKLPTYRVYDKKTGGYFNGQTIVCVLLVTEHVTLPVGFDFYVPDPCLSEWKRAQKKLKKKGIARKNWPPKPQTDQQKYPTKTQIAARLLAEFRQSHPDFKVNAIIGDNHYGSAQFMHDVSTQTCPQVVSVLKSNQLVHHRGKKISLADYFKNKPFEKTVIQIRGQQDKTIWYCSARLFVEAHGCKRMVIALHYDDQDKSETRYIIATELSWRTLDIIRVFTFRWLIEVFFEDLKVYEGWGQLAKQSHYDGSRRVLTLSLLLDHCLFFYGPNKTRLENKQPAATVGSLTEHIRAQGLFECVQKLTQQYPGGESSEAIAKLLHQQFKLHPSKKHMHGLSPGHQAPSPSLQRRFPSSSRLAA